MMTSLPRLFNPLLKYKENVYLKYRIYYIIPKTLPDIYMIMILNYIPYLGIYTYSNFKFDLLLIPFMPFLPKVNSKSFNFKTSIIDILEFWDDRFIEKNVFHLGTFRFVNAVDRLTSRPQIIAVILKVKMLFWYLL